MKWILIVSFLAFKLFAESKLNSQLNDLPTDVQKEISKTEDVQVATTVDKNEATSTVTTEKNLDEKSTAISEKSIAKEAEIPLSLEATKKVVTTESTYFRIMMVIALLGILASGVWILVRKNKFKNIKRNKNEIKILAQHYLGPKKSLAVVRVAGESILVGVTDTHINMLKTLSLMDDELPEVTSHNFKSELDVRMNHGQDENQNTQYESAVSTTYNRKSQVTANANSKSTSNSDDIDEFSIRGIKDLVSTKLKNMRSI